jgi:hypothetical protein
MSAIVLEAIRTALTDLLPSRMDTPAARLMMLAIQKQEDPEERRYQVVKRTAILANLGNVFPGFRLLRSLRLLGFVRITSAPSKPTHAFSPLASVIGVSLCWQ